ncbi:hypothetical protein [Paenibacillus sp. UMB4589-SE434]|uniref:hypothetical protein n=1 Tax=Paenibacillus sp. UMB4589-SE434 TaxID=3046314 RepID=UPI00254A60BC|nr:hypothetical protein [Paenibacillus sp. UMB4589-SE434]MDK8182121.1 hypothetical protein [Paenibacillus sp. UMB4589-SE434]
MRTLVIYDKSGYIIQVMSGDVREPIGIPYLSVEIPEGKQIERVDVSTETHVAVFSNVPKSVEKEVSDIKQSIAELTMLLASKQ